MRSITNSQWTEMEVEENIVNQVIETYDLPKIAAKLAANRWPLRLKNLPLYPNETDLHDPFLMLGMERAVKRIRQAVDQKESVRIVTDYDVDGTTSSLLLQATLTLLGGGEVSYHIPNRFSEGYGFSTTAAQKAADDGVDLIITADIGVRDHAAVNSAILSGLDVIIVDHHLPDGGEVPQGAIVLCPPQADCHYPNRSLAAVGISLKVAQATLSDHPKWPQILPSLLKLAALGTVADLVSLADPENRSIVALGLKALNQGPHHPGLSALLKVSGVVVGGITEIDLGYRVGPRINAAGRLADASLVVRLLQERSPHKADVIARQLNELNQNRKTLQDNLIDSILKQIPSNQSSFVVMSGSESDGWHRGIVGVVASRIKEEAGRPTAIASIQGEMAVGSIRSTPTVNAVKALDSVSNLLEKYGGHPAAAGFTIRAENLVLFEEGLCRYVNEATEPWVEVYQVDAWLRLNQITQKLVEQIGTISPFGMGNPSPKIAISKVRPKRVAVRAGGRLLVFTAVQDDHELDVIWWGRGDIANTLAEEVDLLGELELNTFRGVTTVQLKLTDIRQ